MFATVSELRDYLDQVPTAQKQVVQIVGAAPATFALQYERATTTSLQGDATASEVHAALAAITSIGPKGVKVSGSMGGPWLIEFQSDRQSQSMLRVAPPADAVINVASEQDRLLADALERATSIVAEALGRVTFGAYMAGSRTVDCARSSSYLRLPPYAVGSITGITLGGVALTDWVERPNAGAGYLYRRAGWPVGTYTVDADWGYGPAPAAITQVTLEVAVNIWRGKAKGMYAETAGVSSIGNAVGGGGFRFIGGLTKQQLAIIEGIRKPYAEWVG